MQSQKQGKTQMLKNQATFNDGICDIYTVQNALPHCLPPLGLVVLLKALFRCGALLYGKGGKC